MREKIGESWLNFSTFRTMAVDHDRILAAVEYGIAQFLPAPLQFEVVFTEVEQLPTQEYFLPELAMSPEEFSRQAKQLAGELTTTDRVTAAAVREMARRGVELVQAYEDVRFHKVSGTVGGAFRPGTVSVFLTPGLGGASLSDRIIGTLAHETYHAASFRVADRRRAILRQHLTYQDERGYAVLEEIMACFFTREVCHHAGCPGEALDYAANREFERLGRTALGRAGLTFAELNRFWLLSAPALEPFWSERGDAIFRGLHLMTRG